MGAENRTAERFGLVFISILSTLVLSAAVGGHDAGRILVAFAEAGTLLLSLRAAGVGPRMLTAVSLGLVVVVAIGAVGAVAGPHSFPRALSAALLCALVAASPVAIVRSIVRDRRITIQTVLGALCVYLLIGLFFSSVFSLIAVIDPKPFFAQGPQQASIDYLYFSYVTLATVGYGDLTAAGNLGKMLAVTEALIGQLYLVSVVALVIGNIGQIRTPGALRRGARSGESAESTAPPGQEGAAGPAGTVGESPQS
jgi:hypothetical protein